MNQFFITDVKKEVTQMPERYCPLCEKMVQIDGEGALVCKHGRGEDEQATPPITPTVDQIENEGPPTHEFDVGGSG